MSCRQKDLESTLGPLKCKDYYRDQKRLEPDRATDVKLYLNLN